MSATWLIPQASGRRAGLTPFSPESQQHPPDHKISDRAPNSPGQKESEESPFNVVVHDQGITVWVNSGSDAEVFDKIGNPAPCGHQRPADAGS
ncbi:hypothetical protein [Streptomyces sp. NPDC017260]|uniref:hypothetical protein n=1 Tax=unclassified Streptomyces TaxID=2593676 RepID=UPI0037995F58